MNPYQIIIRPLQSEKSAGLAEDNRFVFRVDRKANKYQIRQAIEQIFGVNVVKVNTMVMPGKPKRAGRYVGRRSGFKKAVVTLAEGQQLDLYAMEAPEGAEV
jgi:large subunit ribosomal protein L23